MSQTPVSIQQSFQTLPPFDLLPEAALQQLLQLAQPLRYRLGQPLLRRGALTQQVIVLLEGQVRLLGYDPRNQQPTTLSRLGRGDLLGVISLIRDVPCETAIASTEVLALTLPSYTFLQLVKDEPKFGQAIRDQVYLIEAFDLLSQHVKDHALDPGDLKAKAERVCDRASLATLPHGISSLDHLDPALTWLISGGNVLNLSVGSTLDLAQQQTIEVLSPQGARLLGLTPEVLAETFEVPAVPDSPADPPLDRATIPYATEAQMLGSSEAEGQGQPGDPKRDRAFPLARGRGDVEGALACFDMLSQYFTMPFRRDVIRRVLANQHERMGQLSLPVCGSISEMMGLKTQLVRVPVAAFSRLNTPCLVRWQESFAVLYETSEQAYILGDPAVGLIRRTPQSFAETWGESGEVLLLEPTRETPQQRFGLQWFWPSIQKYRWVLLEVFVASFFVQLFGLANPLIVQIIIDRVIVQNSIETLQVLGIFLVIMAVFEALLTSLRTYLFVDTTNRIDMTLGSEIIDHLFRLPLRYFDRRPVGELSSRINELENIRQFLTGTALTVVLDAVFSVVYIVVMLIYSWLLTLVALVTIPLFVLVTMLAAPIVRRQLRTKAERNASTQALLVESLSGIQTVKAQNIELRTRWQWQERYAEYVSAGFKTVLTSTTANSASTFLNKLSALLVLWVGAYLVLQGQLTLGQLIAFRIISGYVTAPILRLAQLWQNFQETALSLERLSDIIDHPQETDADDINQIPMPEISGQVTFEQVAFRFAAAGPMQLMNINLEFPAGAFIGIVGQSGSGKSTLMKLLPRLYEVESGRILIDQYDISKVELYSLRRQIGIVPQDSLLFEGTIQDNIALTIPDADASAIITAAKTACCHDFIMELPLGYNTRVGERGANLSGGQRQRIAIARTILQNPRLLILDEATSALDYDTEHQVSINLKAWAEGRTVFFITHRLNTIMQADQILVMDQGSAVELGTHEELMALQGRYYTLYQQQSSMG
ncbi:type I secretion system permease/ATPase [Nodosilinea sp. P-1105]|uniref:peptidase domain-containing ABC transporter n=1 Tax=Nodosilinea sp. P-1105 TaxID=2546229 RepID=UPI00146C5EE1|nr:type I secretion system permease/ATPase [Nodosilinea sp. P-1105]NMF82576.1 type I secretion system permease/ATPase [Nodosilinea sp. P-1105]